MNKQNFVEIFDIYGKSYSLKLFGKENYKTTSGAIIAVLTLIGMAFISVVFVIDLFKRKKITLTYNEDVSTLPINNITDIPIMFGISDSSSQMFLTDKLFSFDVKMVYNIISINSDGVSKMKQEVIPIPLEVCDLEKHFGNYKDLFVKINITGFGAIDFFKNL